MTDERHSLILGLAIIASIVTIYGIGALKGSPADIAVLTGLIGILGTFTRPRTVNPDTPTDVKVVNPPEDPANVQEQK